MHRACSFRQQPPYFAQPPNPMVLATAPPPSSVPQPQQRQKHHKKIILPIALVAGVVLCAGAVELRHNWPYSQFEVLQDLREASDSQVQIRTFHQTFFPSPGCVLEGLVFRHSPSASKPHHHRQADDSRQLSGPARATCQPHYGARPSRHHSSIRDRQGFAYYTVKNHDRRDYRQRLRRGVRF